MNIVDWVPSSRVRVDFSSNGKSTLIMDELTERCARTHRHEINRYGSIALKARLFPSSYKQTQPTMQVLSIVIECEGRKCKRKGTYCGFSGWILGHQEFEHVVVVEQHQ